ncbi:BTAD domain-containing putative transcriptional regulator [Ornithinimicrobium sp. W1679]|uniref:BTAD domain-containing putative transcriptional regulator n=1 Tax=Ornithinimicrobium sp. W1679 TaxID=3418770 RepID=UPI003CF11575
MEPDQDIRIRVLGPVRVSGLQQPLAPKQGLLLGTLALAGAPVPADTLTALLWGDDPPDDPRPALQVHISKLRRSIAPTGATVHRDGERYSLVAGTGHVDVACFEELVTRGCELVSSDPARARDVLRAALGLWRGPPLDGAVGDTPHQAAVGRLCDLRLRAVEKRVEADLATGHHADTVAELRQLTSEHPLHERLAALLMTALYRAGRAGEALVAFERVRRTLADELGADPSPELCELHRAILRQDEVVGRPPAAAPRPPDPASVAVLPFTPLGPESDATLLAAGLHTDVLAELARVPHLTVISRHSVQRYPDAGTPAEVVAHDLGVASIVTGTVQVAGGRFRLTVQLVDAVEGVHRWVESYDRRVDPADLLVVQTELARDIAESLSHELAPAVGAAHETASMETYRWIAEARMQFDRKTEEGLARSVELFQRVVRTDPVSAAGWVGLGQSLAMTADYGYGDREALLDAAESALDRARQLGPNLADLHVCRGLVAESRQDAPVAEREYLDALRAQPGHADAASWHAWISLTVGEADRALASARRAVRLNPLSAEAVSNLALALLAVDRPGQALAEARRADVLSPGYTTAAYYEGLALYDLGRFADAATVLEPLRSSVWGGPSTPWASRCPDAAYALAQARAGRPDRTRQTLDTVDPHAYPVEAGLIHAGLGQDDEAWRLFGSTQRVGFGPAMALWHHFRDVWAALGPDARLEELAAVVRRSWNLPVGATRAGQVWGKEKESPSIDTGATPEPGGERGWTSRSWQDGCGAPS